MNNQITPMTCGLACLESILEDFGMPATQAELMLKYKNELLYGLPRKDTHCFGALNNYNLPVICAALNLKLQNVINWDKSSIQTRWKNVGKTKGVIAGITKCGQHHMMKLVDLQGEDASFLEPCFFLDEAQPVSFTLDELASYNLNDWIIEK